MNPLRKNSKRVTHRSDSKKDILLDQVCSIIIISFRSMLEAIPKSHQSRPHRRLSTPLPPHSSSLDSQTLNPEDPKEKSQLCRSFSQFGFCPYRQKCKFAHGSQQLLRNHQFNIKYKTKDCQNFLNTLCCMYGTRCNFIHPRHPRPRSPVDPHLSLIRCSARNGSRLLQLLEQ